MLRDGKFIRMQSDQGRGGYCREGRFGIEAGEEGVHSFEELFPGNQLDHFFCRAPEGMPKHEADFQSEETG